MRNFQESGDPSENGNRVRDHLLEGDAEHALFGQCIQGGLAPNDLVRPVTTEKVRGGTGLQDTTDRVSRLRGALEIGRGELGDPSTVLKGCVIEQTDRQPIGVLERSQIKQIQDSHFARFVIPFQPTHSVFQYFKKLSAKSLIKTIHLQ